MFEEKLYGIPGREMTLSRFLKGQLFFKLCACFISWAVLFGFFYYLSHDSASRNVFDLQAFNRDFQKNGVSVIFENKEYAIFTIFIFFLAQSVFISTSGMIRVIMDLISKSVSTQEAVILPNQRSGGYGRNILYTPALKLLLKGTGKQIDISRINALYLGFFDAKGTFSSGHTVEVVLTKYSKIVVSIKKLEV